DDVLVAGQHQALLGSIAELQQVLRFDSDGLHRFDRPEDEMKPGAGGARIFAEVQHDALLFGAYHINRVVEPDGKDKQQREKPGHSTAGTAGQGRFELVLDALNQILQIGRRARSAAAGAIGALAPWAAPAAARPSAAPALILPWHEMLSSPPYGGLRSYK